METQRDHHAIEIGDKPKSGIESSIREIQETINKSAFIVIQRRLNELRRLEETESRVFRSYSFSNSPHIFRVPQSLKEMSCYAAEPELVSIGPYHRGKPAVLEFENSTKWKLVDFLLRRTEEATGVVLQRLVDAMKELDTKARDFYSEPIEMSHDDFIQMMVIDGGFVVELLQHVCGDDEQLIDGRMIRHHSPILMKPGLIPVLTRDLLKLENQLPFFVLEKIFDLCIAKSDPLRLMALKLFSHSLPRSTSPESLKRAADHPNCRANHLLELFHSSYIIPIAVLHDGRWISVLHDGRWIEEDQHQRTRMRVEASNRTQQAPQPPSSNIRIVLEIVLEIISRVKETFGDVINSFWNLFSNLYWKISGVFRSYLFPRVVEGYHPLSDQSMQCVTRLRHAGIRFRPRRSTYSFLQVQFHKGVLEIPPITINDITIAALINCVAWEHCRPHTHRCFSAYVAFMNCLIKSDRDVTFLCDDGIITSFSHDDHQIAQTFKELGDKVANNIRECYLSKQFEEVEAYYGSHWATLRRTYFRSPWSFISLVTAALVVGFTAIQAIMAILSYVKPPHQ